MAMNSELVKRLGDISVMLYVAEEHLHNSHDLMGCKEYEVTCSVENVLRAANDVVDKIINSEERDGVALPYPPGGKLIQQGGEGVIVDSPWLAEILGQKPHSEE